MAIDGMFVLDAVSHTYNLAEDNYAGPDAAAALSALAFALATDVGRPEYALPEEVYRTEWGVDEPAAPRDPPAR